MPQLWLPQSCRLELSFEIKQARQINALLQVQSPCYLHNIIEYIFLCFDCIATCRQFPQTGISTPIERKMSTRHTLLTNYSRGRIHSPAQGLRSLVFLKVLASWTGGVCGTI
jgi:hypothetical protein